VSLHEVTAHRRPGHQRALEIYQTIAAKLFQVCAIEGFLEKIERQLVFALRADGQATTIYCHAVANGRLDGQSWRCNLKLGTAIRHPDPQYFGDFLDQTGEHAGDFNASARPRQLQTAPT